MSLAESSLDVLVVDDEPPALDELAYLLRSQAGIREVATAGDATEALRVLRARDFAVVFLDIRMPGLDGLELARVLSRFANPPVVVFVTAFEQHAVEAFEIQAADYLLKPVRAERLAEALRRAEIHRKARAGLHPSAAVAPSSPVAPIDPARPDRGDEARDDAWSVIPVEYAGRTRFVPRDEVRFVEASGDYARLHTANASYLVRTPLATLEQHWERAGFFRIHRRFLVALRHISELRADTARGCVVRVGDRELPVSRRQTRELRDRLVRVTRSKPAPMPERKNP